MTETHTLSLCEARKLLADGGCKPSELVRNSLDRIRATEPQINACITVCEEQAMREAEQQDALLGTAEAADKPLFGIPVTVKDAFCTTGIATTCASRMLENFIPYYNAHAVDLLREAGAIIVAKTNQDEFAMGSSTQFSVFGPTRNPWDVSCVPGGSSGGSAASVAACQAFGSLGSDSGGSIRQPAGLCGCVGIKPTYGRISRFGVVAYASSFDQVGTFGRNVQDASLLLQTVAGYDPRDATSSVVETPVAPEAFPPDLRGKTLGLPTEFWEQDLSSEVEARCREAVARARDLGATIVELSLPHLRYSVAAYYILASGEASTNLARFDGVRYGLRAGEEDGLVPMYVASRSQGFGVEVKRRILLGTYALSAGYYEAYYKKASQIRRLVVEDYEKALEKCDALLAPVSPVTAWKLGEYINDPLTSYKMDILTLGLNLAGLPGVSLPAGLGTESGMPVGLQISGRAFDEQGILSIAGTLERALPAIGMPPCA